MGTCLLYSVWSFFVFSYILVVFLILMMSFIRHYFINSTGALTASQEQQKTTPDDDSPCDDDVLLFLCLLLHKQDHKDNQHNWMLADRIRSSRRLVMILFILCLFRFMYRVSSPAPARNNCTMKQY
jgi:hypothetical protein